MNYPVVFEEDEFMLVYKNYFVTIRDVDIGNVCNNNPQKEFFFYPKETLGFALESLEQITEKIKELGGKK